MSLMLTFSFHKSIYLKLCHLCNLGCKHASLIAEKLNQVQLDLKTSSMTNSLKTTTVDSEAY